MTQAMCEPPSRSPTIVGSAVETMVWSSAASSMPSMSAPMMSRIERWLRPGSAPFPTGGAATCGRRGRQHRPFSTSLPPARGWRAVMRHDAGVLPASRRHAQRYVAQRAVLRESVGERLEGRVGELVERDRAAEAAQNDIVARRTPVAALASSAG